MIKLCACPFCARHPVACQEGDKWQVQCLECGARGPETYDEAEAEEQWNDALKGDA